MHRLAAILPPIANTDLAHSIASWLRRVSPRMLVMTDSDARDEAADVLGELIVAAMTMTYPRLLESSAPPLLF